MRVNAPSSRNVRYWVLTTKEQTLDRQEKKVVQRQHLLLYALHVLESHITNLFANCHGKLTAVGIARNSVRPTPRLHALLAGFGEGTGVHGCHFCHPCSRPVFTDSVYRRQWTRSVNTGRLVCIGVSVMNYSGPAWPNTHLHVRSLLNPILTNW